MNEEQVNEWFESRSWLSGLNLEPHKSINQEEFAKQYSNHRERWDKAFDFLKSQDLENLTPGKYEIDGDEVFALIAEAPSKTFEESTWESHRLYQDIQHVVRGAEKIGITSPASATVTDPYDAATDLEFYTGEGNYYVADPGNFFIFFPEDLHRPNIVVDEYPIVKKVVIKVAIGDKT